MKIQFGIELTEQDMSDIVVTGLESGCYATFGIEGFKGGTEPPPVCEWIDMPDIRHTWAAIVPGHAIELFDRYAAEDGEESTHILDREALERGIRVWVRKYPHQFKDAYIDGELDTSMIDAGIADTILQCAIFGEAIYG